MWLFTLVSAVLVATLASAESKSASIYIQPVVSGHNPPSLIAEVQYDTANLDITAPTAEVTSYEAPDLPDGASLVRIGIYDTAKSQWASSTSVASVDNFSKGYSPHFMVSVDGKGEAVLGASVRGVRIDAGQTRDFGPQALVLVSTQGKQPELNKPIVLSPEGKKVVVEEKSMLQKSGTPDSLRKLLC